MATAVAVEHSGRSKKKSMCGQIIGED